MAKSKRNSSEMFSQPVKLWHSLNSITMDLTYTYFDATDLVKTLGNKGNTLEFKKLLKTALFSTQINSVIEKVRKDTSHEIYPIKCVTRGAKAIYYCHIDLLLPLIQTLSPDSHDLLTNYRTISQDAADIRKTKSFASYLDRIRRYRVLYFETSLIYSDNEELHQYDFEQFLNEYDAIHQSKHIVINGSYGHVPLSEEMRNVLIECAVEKYQGNSEHELRGVFENLEIIYEKFSSFSTNFPLFKDRKYISTIISSESAPSFIVKYDKEEIVPEDEEKEETYIERQEYINEYAKLVSIQESYNNFVCENINLKLSIKMCNYNISDQASRKMTILNEIIRYQYRNTTIPVDIHTSLTLRDSEAKKLQAECKKILEQSKKYQDDKLEITRKNNLDNQQAESVLQSDKEKFTSKEYNEVLKSIQKMTKMVEKEREEFIILTKKKEEYIILEELAFGEKNKCKIEFERLKNPLSPRPIDMEKNQAIIAESMIASQVKIRNEYRRDKLNFLDEVDHLKTKALFACKREIVDYEFSTLDVQEKLAQCKVSFANGLGARVNIGEVTSKYTEGRQEREMKRKALSANLDNLQSEELMNRSEKIKRWNQYEDTKNKHGNLEEIQEEIAVAIKERSVANAELHKAREEFRLYSNNNVIKVRNVRNYWLIYLMSFARQNKINSQEINRWCHQEFRNPSKINIPKESDLGIPEFLKKIPEEFNIHCLDMCRILITEKPPALKIITQRGSLPPSSSNIFLGEDISKLTSTPRESTVTWEEEIIPLSPRWADGIRIGCAMPLPIIPGESKEKRKVRVQAKLKALRRIRDETMPEDAKRIMMLEKGIAGGEEELRRCLK